MKGLSAFRPELQKRVRNAPKVLLFLDYDGTLVPIRPTPELARLSPERKKILAGLVRLAAFNVGILTGRSLKDIRKAVKITGLFFAANYGLAIEVPKKRWVHPEAKKKSFLLKKMLPRLRKLGSEFRGVRIEDKTLTVAIHYRQFKGRPEILKSRLEEIIRARSKPFKLNTGKKIFEVYPTVKWDKGRALLKVERLLGHRGAPLVIFFGDDHADEEAFRCMRPQDISVAVGRSKKSAARYFCQNSREVGQFLKLLLNPATDGKK